MNHLLYSFAGGLIGGSIASYFCYWYGYRKGLMDERKAVTKLLLTKLLAKKSMSDNRPGNDQAERRQR